MTNPNNAIGTNGAYGGRTSVNAFNDNLAIYQGRGILSGFAVSPNAGMSVAIGGNGTTRDVAIAEDNIGNMAIHMLIWIGYMMFCPNIRKYL